MRRTEWGQALLETALVVPFLIVLVAGVVDLGRAFGQFMIASNAAREGARYGSRYSWDLGTISPASGIKGAASAQAGGTGVTVNSVTVTCIDTCGATVSCGTKVGGLVQNPPPKGSSIRVVVEYRYLPILSAITGIGSPLPIWTGAEMIIFGMH